MTDKIERNKTLNGVKNMNKNLPSFLDIDPMQEEVLPSHKAEDHLYK